MCHVFQDMSYRVRIEAIVAEDGPEPARTPLRAKEESVPENW
jgi:hypothetical protein